MATLELEILGKDGKTWNVLKTSEFENDLPDLKKAKEKFYTTLFSDRQMRIVKTTNEGGKLIQTIVG